MPGLKIINCFFGKQFSAHCLHRLEKYIIARSKVYNTNLRYAQKYAMKTCILNYESGANIYWSRTKLCSVYVTHLK